MKRRSAWMLFVGLVVTAGCRRDDKSPVVRLYQEAGGGDVTQSTPDSIAQFLAKHEELRQRLTPLCQPVEALEDGSEGGEEKVCDGNTRANFFGKTKVKSDGVAF